MINNVNTVCARARALVIHVLTSFHAQLGRTRLSEVPCAPVNRIVDITAAYKYSKSDDRAIVRISRSRCGAIQDNAR